MKTMLQASRAVIVTVLVCLLISQPGWTQGSGPPPQPANMIYNEMQTVYLGNLARRDNGVPPLRWNAPMTDAARWFSWDSVENRDSTFCGHKDTLGRWPSTRVPAFGYQGFCGAENAYCGYVTPQQAIDGWMASEGHRENLLDPCSREVGLGYYQRESDGRGYVTQDFGHDPAYPPVIINNEAINTTSTDVDLYIYDREGGGGFAELGPATEMMISNNPCFTDASWESYATERTWSLEPGTGWRTVYVKTRDAVGRTVTVSDTIYLGDSAPLDELGLHLASTNSDHVTLWGLEGGGLDYVQLSQNWFVDDTYDTFDNYSGEGERVNDPEGVGGTAYRLSPGSGDSYAWVWTTEFAQDIPLVAYFRLKVSDNASPQDVARLSISGGSGTEYGPVYLYGTDFDAAGEYQEFPIAFTFDPDSDDPFLIFHFQRTGSADIYVDGVYIFTAPQPIQSPLNWSVPGGNYRGGGIWLRYTNNSGTTFSPVEEANLNPERIAVRPTSLFLFAEYGTTSPITRTLSVREGGCESFTWSVEDNNPAWLDTQSTAGGIEASIDVSGLTTDTYHAAITVTTTPQVIGSPSEIPVTLMVVDEVHHVHLPLVLRSYSQ